MEAQKEKEVIDRALKYVAEHIQRKPIETPKEKAERLFNFHLEWVEAETGGYFNFIDKLKKYCPTRHQIITETFEHIFKEKTKYLKTPTDENALILMESIQNWTIEVLNNYDRAKNLL